MPEEFEQTLYEVSVALARRLMWTMLGAEFLEKRPAQFPDRVSDGLPDVFPGWTAPEFQ